MKTILSEIFHACIYGLVGELVIHIILLSLCSIVIFRYFGSRSRGGTSVYGVMMVTLYTMQSLISFFITENNSLYVALYFVILLSLIAVYVSLVIYVKNIKLSFGGHSALIAFIIFSASTYVINVLPHFANINTLNGTHRLPGFIAALALFVLIHQVYIATPEMNYENGRT